MTDQNNKIQTLKSLVREIDREGKSLLSINDLSNDQIYKTFELARILEPWNRSKLDLLSGNVLAALFFQPSTRTRMSFETAMHRLGGAVITEANPMVSSSAAKEESLADMMKVMSKYANVIVLRHPDDKAALEGAGQQFPLGISLIILTRFKAYILINLFMTKKFEVFAFFFVFIKEN